MLDDWNRLTVGPARHHNLEAGSDTPSSLPSAERRCVEERKAVSWNEAGAVTFMQLVHEFTCSAMLKPPLPVGPGPIGTRVYYEVERGEITGDRLSGAILGGGEWALIGPDGYLRVDVRLQAETHDGAYLYIQYCGLLELNEAVQGALASGAGTDYGEQYFFTNPRFETGDARYAWLNTTFFVGEGHLMAGSGVEYRVSRPA
jgi:hypothetical protein